MAVIFDHRVPAESASHVERIEQSGNRGVITSGEVLAIVSPKITSQVRAAGVSDPELRRG